MTIVTVNAAIDVRRMLAGRRDSVVAGPAGTDYLRMVDNGGRFKRCSAVAVLTNIGGLHV